MLNGLINKLRKDKVWDNYHNYFTEISVPAKTLLLKEGETSKNIFFVKKGCLRSYLNNEGKDVTFQFFFENRAVSSFLGRKPSLFNLESVEPSSLITIRIKDFYQLLQDLPELKDDFLQIVLQRMEDYSLLFLSRIKDTPQKRYCDLVKNSPDILQRIPQHYIASYLGITPVSLSRIRNRKL
jgi:CRP-like cAMP-binding protein